MTLGEPVSVFKVEKIAVPTLEPDEVIGYVLPDEGNYTNVWAARSFPVDVIVDATKEDRREGAGGDLRPERLSGVLDLWRLWIRYKQGLHFGNDEPYCQRDGRGRLDPWLSRISCFDEIPPAHRLLHEPKHPHGNMAALVGASHPGLTGLA